MHRYIPCAACWWLKAPKPPVIDVAASDAQAAVGVCWYILAGKAPPGGAAPGGRTMAAGHTTASLLVVSKCALSIIILRNRASWHRKEALASRFPVDKSRA